MLLLYFFLKKKYRIQVFVGSELFRTEVLKNKPKHSFCAEFHELSEFPIEIKKSDVENPQKKLQRGPARTIYRDRIYAVVVPIFHWAISMLFLFLLRMQERYR